MKFFEYTDIWSFFTRKYRDIDPTVSIKDHTMESFYNNLESVAFHASNPFSYRQAALERDWIGDNRPYYNVYPAIFDMVERLKLDIPCQAIQSPLKSLCLRLPEASLNPYIFNNKPVKTIMFGEQQVSKQAGSLDLVRGLVIAIDTGELGDIGDPILTFKLFPLREDLTIDKAIQVLPYHDTFYLGDAIDENLVNAVVKLCCCVCLIGQDPDLVCPDVLAKDRSKFREANEEQQKIIIDRARRRGKYGFNLGAGLEVVPHYRRPHLAIVWTGKGRAIPKIVMRKGSVVHKEKISEVPTGRLDHEPVEPNPPEPRVV